MKKLNGLDARVADAEQRIAQGRGLGTFGPPQTKSIGTRFVESEEFKSLQSAPSQSGRARTRFETKNISSATGSAGGTVIPDYRPEIIALPQRRMVVRDLLAPGQTNSNTVYYVQQTGRTNNAATVAENPSSAKPQSDYTFANKNAPVTTVAHWIKASRQIMDDAPALASTIDSELRYGLADVEERQLLFGDGTGTNLLGLVPQATAYVKPTGITVVNATMLDVLLLALAQAEQSLLPATGMVVNTIDWFSMIATKDSQNRYLGNGPFGNAQLRSIWDLPVVPTMAMPQGQFLVGSFGIAAQIFDRLEAEVLLSTEDVDNFEKNMITVRAEERLALVVKRPAALITGAIAPATSGG